MKKFSFRLIVCFFFNIMPFLGYQFGNLAFAQNSGTEISIHDVKIDSSGCIHQDKAHGCTWDSLCPSDTPYYRNVKLMMYVDSHLAENEPKAFLRDCGANAKILANDSIELFIFERWYGGSYEEKHAYYRKIGGKFRRLKFNEDNWWRNLKVLKEKNNGVHIITVQGWHSDQKYRLSFNGKNGFDTTHIKGIPYDERKNVGIGSNYMHDSVYSLKNADFKFLANKKYALDTESYEVSLIYCFMKMKKVDSMDYQFVGYFKSLPVDHYFSFKDGFELTYSGFRLPIFKVISLPRDLQERIVRHHYWDGNKYVGILMPETINQLRFYEKEGAKMHPKYHLEYLPGK